MRAPLPDGFVEALIESRNRLLYAWHLLDDAADDDSRKGWISESLCNVETTMRRFRIDPDSGKVLP